MGGRGRRSRRKGGGCSGGMNGGAGGIGEDEIVVGMDDDRGNRRGKIGKGKIWRFVEGLCGRGGR